MNILKPNRKSYGGVNHYGGMACSATVICHGHLSWILRELVIQVHFQHLSSGLRDAQHRLEL